MSFSLPAIRRLPMIFQAETSECGIACLAMVSEYYGKGIDMANIRSRFGVEALGASAKQLMGFASKLQLRSRAIKVEVEDLRKLQLPAVLHWDMDHFVVLKKVSNSKVSIHDPAAGIRSYGLSELGVHLTGIALEFIPNQEFTATKKSPSLSLQRLFSGMAISPVAIFQVFAMTLCIQLLALLSPLYLQLVIDQGLAKGDTDLILMLAILFILLMLVKAALAHIRGLHILQFGNRVGFQLVGGIARHLISLPLNYFERREMGDIVSRFGSLENIRRLVTQEMITILVDGIFSVVTLLLLYLYDPLLASIVFGFVVFNALIRFTTISREQELRKESLIVGAKQQTRFMENVRSIITTKVNDIEQNRHQTWETTYAEHINAGYRLETFQLNLSSIQSMSFGVENILIILIGSMAVVSGSVTLGQLMSFIFLKQHFTSSVLAMLPKYAEIRLINLELDRVSDITNQQAESQQTLQIASPTLARDIRLSELGFAYRGNKEAVLKNITFTVPANQCTAITGPSGSGKSTLLKLLLRLEDPTSGKIVIGDTELANIPVSVVRQQCSALVHGDGLLAGDLAYNIHLGENQNDWQAIEAVCNLVGLTEIVKALPLGFATDVGEMGSLFSAGQIQRILLARALFRSPKILALDESLSHLDTKAAIHILDALKSQGITILLVTHSPELIAYCDHQLEVS